MREEFDGVAIRKDDLKSFIIIWHCFVSLTSGYPSALLYLALWEVGWSSSPRSARIRIVLRSDCSFSSSDLSIDHYNELIIFSPFIVFNKIKRKCWFVVFAWSISLLKKTINNYELTLTSIQFLELCTCCVSKFSFLHFRVLLRTKNSFDLSESVTDHLKRFTEVNEMERIIVPYSLYWRPLPIPYLSSS